MPSVMIVSRMLTIQMPKYSRPVPLNVNCSRRIDGDAAAPAVVSCELMPQSALRLFHIIRE